MYFLKIAVLSLLSRVSTAVPISDDENTLVLLNVLFRHGDRTPEPIEMYPKDPYGNQSYYQEGLGELTKAGKRREFNIGRALRKRYGLFLGSYKSSEVIPITTDYIRTKMSCLLVLAGLYPPNQHQIWEEGFNWIPIPYNHGHRETDYLLGDPIDVCPKFIKAYNEYWTKENEMIQNKNKNLYDYVSESTGLNIQKPRDLYNLQFVLAAQEAMGLELPPWAKSVWPENITIAAVEEYYLTFATPEMKKLSGGFFLRKIIENTEHKIANNSNDESKIYLYSAHENNVAYPLMIFDAFHPHIPPYGSYIVIEIHKIDNVYGVKVLYEDYTKVTPTYINILDCGEFCPFEKFKQLTKESIPASDETC
ncbi:hypothetical protein FQA39_LY02236 [Lamprigera yunnana]|nr:hypothetical protein FQA39_LY02236 [Lamprigera yunnana]